MVDSSCLRKLQPTSIMAKQLPSSRREETKIAQDEILGKRPNKVPEPQRGGSKLVGEWFPALTILRFRKNLRRAAPNISL
jgi:hypothetical protein